MNKYDEEIKKILRKYTHPQQAITWEDRVKIESLRIQSSYQRAIDLVNKGAKLRKEISRKLRKINIRRVK